MNSCFSFRFIEKEEDKRSSLVVYSSAEPNVDEILITIKKSLESFFIPKYVYLIVRDRYRKYLEVLVKESIFKNEFENLVNDAGSNSLKCGVVCGEGVLLSMDGQKFGSGLRSNIFQSGMLNIFEKRKGVISSSSNYHFAKPSGDHCDKFIRASNLLISSSEVSFLSLSLLPYLTRNIKRIYIDTSSIAYLVTMAIKHSKYLSGTDVAIESFGSYSGFNNSYDFIEDEDSLVLISATTSGSMGARILNEVRFNQKQVITLFHTSSLNGQVGVFDISSAVPNGIYSSASNKCDLCEEGARLISISGEQFLPEPPSHDLLLIRKADFNSKREALFKEFATKEVFLWNKRVSAKESTSEHFYIDLEKVLSDDGRFINDLSREVNRNLTRHTNTIVHLDDEGSKDLAAKIAELSPDLVLLGFSELNSESIAKMDSVLVVAGAITSGRQLLSISRKLRALKSDASITYFVGFSKLPNKGSQEQLEKDLRMGGNRIVVLRQISMPRIKEYNRTAWNIEYDYLSKFTDDDPLSGNEVALPVILKDRLNCLSQASGDKNKLFLKKPNSKPQILRKTFAFWSSLELEKEMDSATQSDVYWTIQTVLHDLREKNDGTGLANLYHTTLISPVCFDRFNDGVIQSCLLRAALPVELNYSVSIQYSRQMTDIISSALEDWDNDQGEASLEFMLALVTKRLQIDDSHLKDVIALRTEAMNENLTFFFDRLSEMSNAV